jgi:hypothetical protein
MRIKSKSIALAVMASLAVAVPLAVPPGAAAVPGTEEEMMDGRYGPRPASDPCRGLPRGSSCDLHYPRPLFPKRSQ